jgi:DNA-binding beta-propeller fold protein YncE
VDLADFSVRIMPIETGEPGVILTDEAILHRNDDPAQLEAYPWPDASGEAIEMVDSVAIGAAGHGEAYDPATGQVFVATDDGLDVATVDGTDLEFVKTLDWDTADRSGGRAFYLRRAPGAGALVTYVTDRSADAWGDWTTDAVIFDPAADSTLRVPLGDGLVYRLGIGDGYALFFTQVPQEDPVGDQAHLLDIDPASETYGQIVASIPLPALSGQGTSATSIWEAGELRIAAMTPDGSLGFVTHGGDGVISVIDTEAGEIVDTIEVPTPLAGGGYLVVAGTSNELSDNIGK